MIFKYLCENYDYCKTRLFLYLYSVKRYVFILAGLLAALFSCSRSGEEAFGSLDRAIELQEHYDSLYLDNITALREQYQEADNDSLKWERAFALEKVLFYHDVDSCYRYVKEMRRLDKGDPKMQGFSESCYANILFKLDSITIAQDVLEKIDTSALTRESFGIYAFAGYHIYGKQQDSHPEYQALKEKLAAEWWMRDSTSIECAYYHNGPLNRAGEYDKAIENLLSCNLVTTNDSTKACYFLALEYSLKGMRQEAKAYLAKSAEYDMKLSVKAYRALYELARMLFQDGDIQRADRYMRIAHQDALSSHYAVQYEDIIHSQLEIMNVLLKQEQERKKSFLFFSVVAIILLSVALVSLYFMNKYSERLDRSRMKVNEISQIKDRFLALYMEKCVDYLNKVDDYRSSLRHTARTDGQAAVMAMLRKPSFADSEFHDLLAAFDESFLGIFPDFVEKVNEHMQPEYRLAQPSEGELSTELRILALIRMGIPQRQKIAKVLNMSVTTVYSYHSLLQKHSRHPDASFDQVVSHL